MNKISEFDVSPEEARTMLIHNVNNRPANKEHVDFLANEMRLGKWKYCADPIRFDENGHLIDGQHRLLAIVKSNTTQKMLVVYNLGTDVFDSLDAGRGRRASDLLFIKKVPHYTNAAAVIKKILTYDKGVTYNFGDAGSGTLIGKLKVSNADILEFSQNTDLTDCINFAAKCMKASNMLTTTDYAFLKFILGRISDDDSTLFLEKLAYGIGLTEGSPILLLRNRLIANATSILKMTGKIKLFLIFRAWNHFRDGNNNLKVLQYSASADFPVPK